MAWLIVAVTAFIAAHPRATGTMRRAVASGGGLVGRWGSGQGTNPEARESRPVGDGPALVADAGDSPYQPIAGAVPDGSRALQKPDGSVVVIDASGAVTESYRPVTASDASGRPVPVYFVTEGGGGVTRVVDVDDATVFPVVLTSAPVGSGAPATLDESARTTAPVDGAARASAHAAGTIAGFIAAQQLASENSSPADGSEESGDPDPTLASRLAVF